MLTVIESAPFQKQASKVWSEVERDAFIAWIAVTPNAGDLVVGAEGARKVRWAVQGRGKSGGVRIIYYYLSEDGAIYLAALYAKNERESMTAAEIKRTKK